MKYINLKTLALILSASALLVLAGCGSNGTQSDTQLVGTVPVTLPPVVPPTNSAPIATPQNKIVYENTKTTPVAIEGTDADGDTLTYTVTTQPANGVLTGTAPNLIYTPETDYIGDDNFEFIVNDGTVDSEVAKVIIAVVVKPKLIIGYYDLALDDGNIDQIQPIDTSDNNATNVGSLANTDLSKYDILFVQNPSNNDYAVTYTNMLPAIANYVSDGGILIFHDRYVTEANISIPGGESIVFDRNFTDDKNITILLENTLLTDGSGGVLTDDSLDNGDSSSHGFAAAISVPVDAIGLLSRADLKELVTFQYPYGDGYVIYSTIPLDYYLAGSSVKTEFSDIYAPNIIDYSVELFLLK